MPGFLQLATVWGIQQVRQGMTALEICVDSVESAVAAEEGGAQRVELCNSLIEGGLTPSIGLIRAVRSRIRIGLHVMIRPRSGDFFYSSDDFEVMREDIRAAAEGGADGVVLGLLTPDGNIDISRTTQLTELARPMKVTFHRAIDLSHNIHRSLEDVLQTGADRILTSGARQTALQGCPVIREMVDAAAGRIQIMAGGGIRAANVAQVLQASGADAFHAALRHRISSPVARSRQKLHLGSAEVDDTVRYTVRASDVRMLRQAITEACSESQHCG